MNKTVTCALACLVAGCGSSHVHSDTTLGRVVVYKNGVAYFERTASIDDDELRLSVPADRVDDLLKSLSVVDQKTGRVAPIAYPHAAAPESGGFVDMVVGLGGPRPHAVKLTYVTEAPAWKATYRVTLGQRGNVRLEGWAIVDNASGEDWNGVKIGVASSSALSFRYDLRTVRFVQRDTLAPDNLFAAAPPVGAVSSSGAPPADGNAVLGDISDVTLSAAGAGTVVDGNRPPLQVDGQEAQRIDRARAAVHRQVEQARRDKDVVKVTCLNDKLVQLDVALRTMRNAATSLERAKREGNADASQHQTSVIAALRTRADQLAAEANQCIGQEAAYVGGSTVSVTIDPSIADPERGIGPAPPPAEPKPKSGPMGGAVREPERAPPRPNAGAVEDPARDLPALVQRMKQRSGRVRIEGFAGEREGDRHAAALRRASTVRDLLVDAGIDPARVVAAAGDQGSGRSAGVRVVELPPDPTSPAPARVEPVVAAGEPVGSAHFESAGRMNVRAGGSAMMSILAAQTEGESVYYYDPESPRGNAAFPFQAVRLRNPSASTLESGPVTVFGDGRFVGEGVCEPIPARSVAIVPFALDRRILVEQERAEDDRITRILKVERGVLSTEAQRVRRLAFTLRSRMDEPAVVYVRHTVPPGYRLLAAPPQRERVGGAELLRVDVPARKSVEIVLEDATPVTRTTDLRTAEGAAMVRAYVQGPIDPKLKATLEGLVKRTEEMGNLEQRLSTAREVLSEYRGRAAELHAQLVTLRAVKSAGPVVTGLEKSWQQMNDKVAQQTALMVDLRERLTVAKVALQTGIAELTLPDQPPGGAHAGSSPAR